MLYAKFIEIRTNVKESDGHNFTKSEIDRMTKTYSKFNFVEFENLDGFSCIYGVIHNNYIPELFQLLVDLSIGFTYKDLTKDILFGNLPKEDFVFVDDFEEDNFKNMVDDFTNEHTDADVVLDKILEFGKESLTEKDILILEKF